MTSSDGQRVVFMSMELSADEVVEMIGRAMVVCSSVLGSALGGEINPTSFAETHKRAEAWLLALNAKYMEDGRVHVKCSTCGQSRDDVIVAPVDLPGYSRVPNPPRAKDARAALAAVEVPA